MFSYFLLFYNKHSGDSKPRVPVSKHVNSMSHPLRAVSNRENVPLSPKDHSRDISRLEKLLTSQISLTRNAEGETERLEHELLAKEKVMYELQTQVKSVNQLNKQLTNKVKSEMDYFEQELLRWKQSERAWEQQRRMLQDTVRELEDTLRCKEECADSLNSELELKLEELEAMRDLVEELQRRNITVESDRNSDEEGELLLNDCGSESDCDIGELDLPDSDYDEDLEMQGKHQSITSELSTQLDDQQRSIQRYQFEIESLKNEKKQLYSYVNKLLKNTPHPRQNDILKMKLVSRKILRTVSSTLTTSTQANKGRRIMSHSVALKSYDLPKVCQGTNSDDEQDDDDNELAIEREFLQLGQILPFALKRINGMKPLHLIIGRSNHAGKNIDLDVD